VVPCAGLYIQIYAQQCAAGPREVDGSCKPAYKVIYEAGRFIRTPAALHSLNLPPTFRYPYFVSTACQLRVANSKLSVVSAPTSRMTSLAPPMGPPWFPSPLLTLGMQGTRGTSGKPRRFCWLATPSHLALSHQGETDFDRYLTGSPLQFSVRLVFYDVAQTVGDSFSPKAFLWISRVERIHSPRRQTLRVQYRGRWDFYRHRGSRYRS
jgi:hypothetical protein